MDQGMNKQCNRECSCSRCGSFFSWKAAFAGALVGIGLVFLLNLFSVAIGLSAFSATSTEGMESIAIGGLLGVAIGTVASMFVAGWVAGYLGRPYCARRHSGSLYGFVAWTLALLISAMFVGQTGRYVSVYADFISHPSVMGVEKMQADVNASPKTTAKVASTATAVETKQAVSGVAISAFVVFALFFAGAFASALGGHYGMAKREDSCG